MKNLKFCIAVVIWLSIGIGSLHAIHDRSGVAYTIFRIVVVSYCFVQIFSQIWGVMRERKGRQL